MNIKSIEDTTEAEQCLQVARDLEIFDEEELRILAGVLDDYVQGIDGYVMFEEKAEDRVIGFIIFGRIPITSFGWEIYWLAVDKTQQCKGIGKKLVKRAEEYILGHSEPANIRVETSTRKEYTQARSLYTRIGYTQVGSIKDYYNIGDDLVIFYKQLNTSKINT